MTIKPRHAARTQEARRPPAGAAPLPLSPRRAAEHQGVRRRILLILTVLLAVSVSLPAAAGRVIPPPPLPPCEPEIILPRMSQDRLGPAREPWEIRVTDFGLAAGFGKEIRVSPLAVEVRRLTDYDDESDSFLWASSLAPSVTSKIAAEIGRFYSSPVAMEFKNPWVIDGSALSLDIRVSERRLQVTLVNVFEADVACIIEAINEALPISLIVRYRKIEPCAPYKGGA